MLSCAAKGGSIKMKNLGKVIGGSLLTLAFVFAISVASSGTAAAQYRNDGQYRRHDAIVTTTGNDNATGDAIETGIGIETEIGIGKTGRAVMATTAGIATTVAMVTTVVMATTAAITMALSTS